MRAAPLAALLVLIVLCGGGLIVLALVPAAPAADRPPAPTGAAWGSDCHFEIVPLESRFFPEQPHPSPRIPASRTLLLDQCTGATWLLAPHGGPPEAVWRQLEREPR